MHQKIRDTPEVLLFYGFAKASNVTTKLKLVTVLSNSIGSVVLCRHN